MKVSIRQVVRNPYDTREDNGDISGLVASIKRNGLFQTFPARESELDPGNYELAFGGRRLAAAK